MNCFSLKSLDLTNFYTNDNINMYGMFYDCNSLTSLIFSNFKTNNQTNIIDIFYGCISLRYIDISSFVTKTNIQLFDSLPNYCNIIMNSQSYQKISKIPTTCEMTFKNL